MISTHENINVQPGGSNDSGAGERNLDGSEPDANVVTGTVVVANVGYIEIDEGKHDVRSNFWGFTYGIAYHPKVGDRVRVHIRPGGRRVYADKIEKVGKTEGGSNKR